MNLEYEERAVKDLIPYDRNTKKHDKAQVENVAESIRQFGFVQPIVIDSNGVVVIGHCRLQAAKKLKMKYVPCVCVESLTPEQVNALRIIDNKTNESEWDYTLLSQELKDVDLMGFDLDFEIEDFAIPTLEDVKDDEVPEVNESEPPKTKRGDIYILGNHRLMCGDSTDENDVYTLVDGEQVDLFLTDPPYNVDYTGKTQDALKIENDSMEDSTFLQFLIDAFSCANSVLKDGGSFYIWHSDSEGYNFRKACIETGWNVRECLVWNKNSMAMGRQDYQWKHEPCLYGWKDGAGHYFIDDRTQTTVIDEKRPSRSELHPTMKPIGLFSRLINNSSKVNESVLDLFGGSGTTLIACEQLRRRSYTMELDPRYCDVIVQRWENLTGKEAVKLNG